MSIVIVGGPKRGKTSLGRLLSQSHNLQHHCTDAQRYVRNAIGTPDRLAYDEVSEWVWAYWMPQGHLLIEGVHAARALQRWLVRTGAGADALSPVTRVIYMVPALERADKPGQRAQTTKVENVMSELAPLIKNVVEFWGSDGQGGFKELPRVELVGHEPSVQVSGGRKKVDGKRAEHWRNQYR